VELIDSIPYLPHALHRGDRAWIETNCYADLWIEILHARGLDPLAMLAFTLCVDFEGDHWTFFKPEFATLRTLYGIEVEELIVWKGLHAAAEEQLARGRIVLAEADAFYLPDTVATDYRLRHTKTTIGIAHMEDRRCEYFHNGGSFTLAGDDFDAVFAPRELAMYCEFAKFDRTRVLSAGDLRAESRLTLRSALTRVPARNPMLEFAARVVADEVTQQGLEYWNSYAFVALRQCGAAFELGGEYLRWLDPQLTPAAAACDRISTAAKALILKGARAANRGRALDAGDALSVMAESWDRAMELLAVA
jgi:Domain of unknown function (DUF1839)